MVTWKHHGKQHSPALVLATRGKAVSALSAHRLQLAAAALPAPTSALQLVGSLGQLQQLLKQVGAGPSGGALRARRLTAEEGGRCQKAQALADVVWHQGLQPPKHTDER